MGEASSSERQTAVLAEGASQDEAGTEEVMKRLRGLIKYKHSTGRWLKYFKYKHRPARGKHKDA